MKSRGTGTGALVLAPSLDAVLNACTLKLDLGFAAQRLFLENGREIFTDLEVSMLDRDTTVYASSGEAFKQPDYGATRLPRSITSRVRFTNTGANFPSSLSHGQTGKRTDPVHKKTMEYPKVLVFHNGNGRLDEGRYVLLKPARAGNSSMKKWDLTGDKQKQRNLADSQFLDRCSSAAGTSRAVTRVFMVSLTGPRPIQEITFNLADAGKLYDTRLRVLLGSRTRGPVWVSDGPGINQAGPVDFLSQLRKECSVRLKRVKAALDAVDMFPHVKKGGKVLVFPEGSAEDTLLNGQ